MSLSPSVILLPMYAGPLRLARALTVSATCVALSLAAHVVGTGSGFPTGSAVAGVGLLMTIVLLTLVMAGLSGRRWTLGRALVALSVGQVGLHAVFTVLLASPHHAGPAVQAAATSIVWMTLAHSVAALVIGVGIAANDSALDTYLSLASSPVGSAIGVLSPWRLSGLIRRVIALAAALAVSSATASAASRRGRFERWQRPRILTDLVVLQCLSRRGPPALAFAS